MTRARVVLSFAVVIAVTVRVMLSQGEAFASAHLSGASVKVTIFGNRPVSCTSCPGVIVLSPKSVKRGTVTFTVTNRSDDFAVFEIAGIASRKMGPNGGRAIVKVVFKKPGVYSATVPTYYSGTTGGLLRVI